MVSHGEVLRSGCDQRMEYDPENFKWLIQGITRADLKGPYAMLPWHLGIMEKTTPNPCSGASVKPKQVDWNSTRHRTTLSFA
jgi:hypothetical protein